MTEPLSGVSSRIEREAAFRAFLADHPRLGGRTFEASVDGNAALDDALRNLRKRARTGKPAVLASNAVVTLKIAAATARLGWHFGDDLGLVGFDETDWAPLMGPGLSTIAQPTDDLGRWRPLACSSACRAWTFHRARSCCRDA